nr:MAG TPA: hypothetical protein [Caudoviricetes sp.]
MTCSWIHKCKTIGNNIARWLYYYQRCYFHSRGEYWFFILRVGQIFGSSKIKPQVTLF